MVIKLNTCRDLKNNASFKRTTRQYDVDINQQQLSTQGLYEFSTINDLDPIIIEEFDV